MKTNPKIILGSAFLIIIVLYWILTPIGVWLTVDDSTAVNEFRDAHRLIAAIAAGVWLLDRNGFRYILIFILAAIFWWIVRNPPSKTS